MGTESNKGSKNSRGGLKHVLSRVFWLSVVCLFGYIFMLSFGGRRFTDYPYLAGDCLYGMPAPMDLPPNYLDAMRDANDF